MARKAVWIAALVVLLSNAVALGFAWVNRAGQADAELTLTERELRLLPRETENTAIALRLAWVDPGGAPGAMPSIDAGSLARLGFDCTAPVTNEHAAHYRNQPPRAAYAVFEFEGDRWTGYLASIPPGPDRQSAEAGSHLVLIDAGLDPIALRHRHPDRQRVVIVPATIGLELRPNGQQPPTLGGRVNALYPLELTVPKHLRAAVEDLPPHPRTLYEPRQAWRGSPLPGAPRFRAAITWGRSFEPWLSAIDRTPTKLSGKN